MLSRVLIPYCNRDSYLELKSSCSLDCDSSHLSRNCCVETALHCKELCLGESGCPTSRCAATNIMTIHNGSLPSLANGDKDSLLGAAKLLMSDEFAELDTTSREEIASVKLYLNNLELLVATKDDDDESSKKPRLTYLRTHLLSEVTVEQDPSDLSCMRVKVPGQRLFLYRLRQGPATMALWMSRINRPCMTRSRSEERLCSSTKVVPHVAPLTNGVIPSVNGEDHGDRKDEDLRRNSLVLSRMSAEWHGEQAASSPLLDLEGILLTSKDAQFQPEGPRLLSDAFDMKNILQERRRSLSASSRPDSNGRIVQTDLSAENGSKPCTTSSIPRKIRFRQSMNRFLTSTTPPRRLSFNRKKRNGEDMGSPPLFTKPKSPGSLLKSFRKRFSSNGLKVSPSVETSPTARHPLSMAAAETDGPWVLGKLYRENVEEVAQQLSLIDAELLDAIDRRELEHCAWMKKSKFDTSPNVLQMIRAFNKLALLVSTEILSERTPYKRMKAISQYIHIASKCYKLHNYNSLNAILAGLQSASVYRLQKSWRLVTAKRMRKYRLLTALMSPDNSWASYKVDLQKQQRRKTHCIPFFGQFLTALSQENSLEDFDTKRPQGAWGNSPVPTVTIASLRRANLSGNSISLPDISVASDASKMDYSDEPLHNLRLLPLTSSQSASDILKLSESSIVDGDQPTVTNIHQTSQQDRRSKHQREDSATWESLPNSQTSVSQRKQQSSLLDDQALNDSAIGMDCDPKVCSETTISNDPQSDSTYELSTIELHFDDDHDIFNSSFLSTNDNNPSAISLDCIAAEAISSDEDSFDEEDSDDEEELARVFRVSSFGTLSQAGILFGASPPQKQTLSDDEDDRSLPNSTPEQDQCNTTSSEPSLPTPDSADDRRTHNRSYSDGTPLSPRASPLKSLSAITGDITRQTAFHLEATTPHLILLEKYKFFSQKYRANFPERPKLRHITKEAHVLTENELFNLSSKRES